MRELAPYQRIVFPLDVPDVGTASPWIARLHGEVGVFKVGLELFTASGPAAVAAVHDAGDQCFLDLKLHDIPATMAGAAQVAAGLGVRFLTVHASAGRDALRATRDAVGDAPTQLLAVTVLTSMDDAELAALGIAGPAEDAVRRLAERAHSAGIDGFVCSPREVALLRSTLGEEVTLVVPGVRPAGSAVGDQKRVATPGDTRAAGADFLVVGRPIRNATDPLAAARAIAAEIG